MSDLVLHVQIRCATNGLRSWVVGSWEFSRPASECQPECRKCQPECRICQPECRICQPDMPAGMPAGQPWNASWMLLLLRSSHAAQNAACLASGMDMSRWRQPPDISVSLFPLTSSRFWWRRSLPTTRSTCCQTAAWARRARRWTNCRAAARPSSTLSTTGRSATWRATWSSRSPAAAPAARAPATTVSPSRCTVHTPVESWSMCVNSSAFSFHAASHILQGCARFLAGVAQQHMRLLFWERHNSGT